MTDNYINARTQMPISTPTNIVSQQQEAGYARLVAVPRIESGAAPCVSVQSTQIPSRIMRLPEVIARVGLRRASIYQHIAAGSFPKQIVLGVRAVGWLETRSMNGCPSVLTRGRFQKHKPSEYPRLQ